MPQIRITRLIVGEARVPTTSPCHSGETPWTIEGIDTTSGELRQYAFCVTDGKAPCDDGGILQLAEAGTITFPDFSCSD